MIILIIIDTLIFIMQIIILWNLKNIIDELDD